MNIFQQLQDDFIHDFHLILRRNDSGRVKKVKPKLITPWQPNHPFRLTWDIFSMAFIIIQMMLIPLILSFEIDDPGTSVFMQIMDNFFLFDILVQFNSAIFIEGKLILKRSIIAITYLKFWFWLDLFSSLPYDMFVEGGNVQMIRMLRFFKFLKVIKMLRAVKLKVILRKIETFMGPEFQSFSEFVKLAFIIAALAHWSACLFNLINYDNYDYITSFYFSITTMITVGYGDVHPVGATQQVYAVFAMILASSVFGYTANSMISIFQYQDPQLTELIEKQQIINKYTKQHDCSFSLRAKITTYLEWVVENDYEVRSSLVINDLSQELKNMVLNQMNLRYFKTLPVQMSLPIKLVETILPPETKLEDDHCIYYIVQGRVSVIANNSFIHYTDKCFGQIGFFSNAPRTAELITEETINIIKISRLEFLQQLDQEQFEKFHMIKNQIENNDYLDLNITCYGCHKKGHVIKFCSKLHYIHLKRAPKQIKFRRQRIKKTKTLYNQFLIEYFSIMEGRRKFKKEQEIVDVVQYNMSIDLIHQYKYFDLDWNIDSVLYQYKLKTITRYSRRVIWKNIKFLIRQQMQKNKIEGLARLKTQKQPSYFERYRNQEVLQN